MNKLFSCVSIISGFKSFLGFCFVMRAFVTAFSVFALLCAHLLLLYFPEEEAQISNSLNDAINMFSNSLTFNIILFFICPSALWQKRGMTYFIRYSPDPCLFQHSHSSIFDPPLRKKEEILNGKLHFLCSAHSKWNDILPLKIKTILISIYINLSVFDIEDLRVFVWNLKIFYLILLLSIKLKIVFSTFYKKYRSIIQLLE